MTAVSEATTADLKRRLAELEERLVTALSERDAAIERQTANALVNFRLQSELRATAERQHASAEILRAISESSGDAERSLTQIAETTARLFGAPSVTIRIAEGDEWIKTIRVGASSQRSGAQPGSQSAAPGANLPATVYQENRQIHIPDMDRLDPSMADWPLAATRAAGARTVSGTPLRREGKAIGALIVYRDRLAPFTEEELALQQSFADQAVIAIENARLFNETQEALERQTATADILKVIASSPSDVRPVFEAIAERARSLLGGFSSTVYRFIDGQVWLEAFTPTTPEADEILTSTFPIPVSRFAPFEIVQAGEVAQIPDTEMLIGEILDIARARGFRSMLFTPLMNEGATIGLIAVTRPSAGRFSGHHVQLLKTFADQAVIALENVRLFDEVQAKTRDLEEALQQQTAVGDVLKTISRSTFDLQPVLDTLVETAAHLCNADMAFIMRREGEVYTAGAAVGFTDEYVDFLKNNPLCVDRGSITGRAVIERRTVQILDVATDPEYTLRQATSLAQQHTALGVPLLRENEPIGVIVIARRRIEAFTQKQIDLVTTFADQAVIAIENVRLFDQLRQRTDDLSESLQQQTATSDVLKVISRSAFDLPAVLNTLVTSASRLCGDPRAAIYLVRDGLLHLEAAHNNLPEWIKKRRSEPLPIGRDTPSSRAALTGQVDHIADMQTDPDFARHDLAELGDYRAALNVPLIREGTTIGVLSLARPTPELFTPRQVEIVKTFADQAVIAIENARLFDEVQARTRDLEESLQQQTATSEVLKVISSSPGELGPVFRSMLENAVSICDAQFGNLLLVDGDRAHWEAGVGTPPRLAEFFTQSAWFQPTPGSHVHRVMRTKQVSHTADDLAESVVGAAARLGGARSTVCVPMVKDDVLVGTIFIYRTEVRPFTDKQVDLVKNFAAQAVIAIENTRLLKELRQRTDDLTKSLDDLRTAQGRLIQTEKLASLGQLTAGIAHEIKNPLNFVNNFAALSAELTVELNDALKPAVLDETIRAEVDELTGLLKDNLGKVVQHGKRADSIVKNMLLHSRAGSGDHRPADVNALVEESLNLAYHGARAEKPQFNVTLTRDLDPDAGMIEAFPQEITRVLLNLISNGFYAVAKRKAEDGDGGFEPVVSATTRGQGDHVEIRIRDNGTGIPPEVKEKMFNPFFTTKPAGEGTGLGLSMSHDIIVKQHGGTIDVDTIPGAFTEFTILLPRTSQFSNKTRGQP